MYNFKNILLKFTLTFSSKNEVQGSAITVESRLHSVNELTYVLPVSVFTMQTVWQSEIYASLLCGHDTYYMNNVLA